MTTTKAKPMALAAKANVKPLNPRSPDTKYVGNEPEWRVQPISNRVSSLSNAFGWYNYFYGKKDAKDFIAAYLDARGLVKDAKLIRALPDSQIRLTTGWLCRMSTMGLELSEHEQIKLENLIQEALVVGCSSSSPLHRRTRRSLRFGSCGSPCIQPSRCPRRPSAPVPSRRPPRGTQIGGPGTY